MNCPHCAKEMLQGHMMVGGGKSWLIWYPIGKYPRGWQLLKHGFPFCIQGSPETGMRLHPITTKPYLLPAWHCPECKKVLLDYDWESSIDYY